MPVIRSGFVVIAQAENPRIAVADLRKGAVIPIDLFCDIGHVAFSSEGRFRVMGDAALAAAGRERRVMLALPSFSGVVRAVAETELIALVPQQPAHHVAGRSGH